MIHMHEFNLPESKLLSQNCWVRIVKSNLPSRNCWIRIVKSNLPSQNDQPSQRSGWIKIYTLYHHHYLFQNAPFVPWNGTFLNVCTRSELPTMKFLSNWFKMHTTTVDIRLWWVTGIQIMKLQSKLLKPFIEHVSFVQIIYHFFAVLYEYITMNISLAWSLDKTAVTLQCINSARKQYITNKSVQMLFL